MGSRGSNSTGPRRRKRRAGKKAWERPLPAIDRPALALPEDPDFIFRFAVYGDNQRGVPIHRRIAKNILIAGAEVVLHVGDYVQDGKKSEQWDEQFRRPARRLLERTLFLGVQGNHDKESPRYYEILRPPGGKSRFKAVREPVAFFGLDSNRRLSQQAEWLGKELENTGEPWKVVFFHEAPYASSWPWPGGSLKTRQHFLPVLEEHRVDLVLAGHIHNYERFHKDGIPYIITGGGGDTLAKPEQLRNPFLLWAAKKHNFITADVYPGRIEVLARDLSGVPFDGIIVEKSGPREIELETQRRYTGPRPKSFPTHLGKR
ncbi:MAG: metallophosphoesterase [Candidatus Erginobacter occultus]|nr:metallophosphoesterase [Candidatus Erginobacter occultus]